MGRMEKKKERFDNESIINLYLTIALLIMCFSLLYYTKGESGIGWFIIGLIVIWG